MVQSYKNESKSQLNKAIALGYLGCDVWYKVTKMRANHNQLQNDETRNDAVTYGTKLQK